MPTFSLIGAYHSNMLSYLLLNPVQCLGPVEMPYAQVLLWKDGEHLCLDNIHLLIELLETHHLAVILMDFCLQQVVTQLNECVVSINEHGATGE